MHYSDYLYPAASLPEAASGWVLKRVLETQFVAPLLQDGQNYYHLNKNAAILAIDTQKTSIGVDTIINEKTSDVISIYVAIGQKTSHVLKVIEEIKTYGDLSRTIFVAAGSSDPFGLQYIAPYSATAMAEYFLDRGRDVLIVYDDLSKHAEAYRSLSLLLKKPPGREAYPGDIFVRLA